ncbi:TPA: site-specific integrase [Yersinia enterocolitica]|uniref:tyrosine-type recombinase/integrase n=1 Tax=Yersinia enterocolitica TaxID=630 RepID=UPI0029C23B65|nr:integrase [Yersinia enterocolitica]EKN5979508.1 integrase [Yersinia enterocolitica]EKN6380632.1 integrase [Yersinia enterocolitica]HDM8275877.1 site-specific integrase [Yersinia enterocolitica]HEI6925583.1 site-specific integrase [Yersinia enterocolitica]
MSQRKNLYRRSSGIYVVRITVPQRFRRYAGQCEIHTSTGTHDLHKAKQKSALLLAVWYQTLQEYEQLDYRTLSDCAPLLAGEGMISFSNFAQSIELPVAQLIQAVMNRNLPVFWLSTGQAGFYVAALSEAELDPLDGSYVLNYGEEQGIEGVAKGYLQLTAQPAHLRNIISDGYSEASVFKTAGSEAKGGWFFTSSCPVIKPDTLLINKVHAESLRLDWLAKSTPPAISVSHAVPLTAPAITNEYVHRKHYTKNLSWLCSEYVKHRSKGKVSESAISDIRNYFAFMIETMGDIQLEKLDRDFFRAYESKLRTIPANRNLVKAKYGVKTLDELIVKAAECGDKLMTEESVRKYINGLYGAMKWAVDDGKLLKSPCENFFPRDDKDERDQDHTDVFESHVIQAVFSLPWFVAGTGERNAQRRFHQYCPFHYWAPLLGLMTGARVNEIAQLLLDDVLADDGVYYLNLESDSESGKKLKNANARRKIPIHSKLISLGFIDYVNALKNAGYIRLFPELKPHKTKGYGRPVSAWFNESLLARRLKIERNRAKSFHSFRHSVSTLLKEKGVSPELRAQLVGHVRGETETEVRYSKDLKPIHMIEVVEKIDFLLPEIAKFNIPDGLDAVRDALRRKKGQQSE